MQMKQFEVTSRGIEKIVGVYAGEYQLELIIPKEIIIEAYKKFIGEKDNADSN